MDIVTLALSKKYTNARLEDLATTGFKPIIVDALPELTQANSGNLYLVPANDPKDENKYLEYLVVENRWECIGSTAIDLGDYSTTSETINLIQEQLVDYEPKDCVIVTKEYLTSMGLSGVDFNNLEPGKYYIAENSIQYTYKTKSGGGSGSLTKGSLIEIKYSNPETLDYIAYCYAYTSSAYDPFSFTVYSNGKVFDMPTKSEKTEIDATWDFLKGLKVPANPETFSHAVNKKFVTDEFHQIGQELSQRVINKTGDAFKVALDNGLIGEGQSVLCTSDYSDDNVSYSKGHIYNLTNNISVAQQLRNLGFTVGIDEFLETNNIKYFYCAGSFITFSSEPLDTSELVLSPKLTWKIKKTYSNQVCYSGSSSNKTINSTPTKVTKEYTDGSSSSAATDTYTNDPYDTKLTHYLCVGDVEDLTSDFVNKSYVDTSISNAVDEASQVFANYYTKEEVEQLIAQAVAEALGTTEAALDEIIEGGE